MAGRVDLSEFVSGFLLEADEHLHSVNRNLVAAAEALRAGRPEPRAVRELFRSLHTIKGLASMVGAEPIVDLAHEMEGILRIADRAGGVVSDEVLDLLLRGTRALEERVHAIGKEGIGAIPPPPAALVEALALAQNAEVRPGAPPTVELDLPEEVQRSLSAADREQLVQAAAAGSRIVLIEFRPSPDRAAHGLNITSAREHLARLGELVKVFPRSSAAAPTGIAFELVLTTTASDAALAEAVSLPEECIREVRVTRAPPAESPPPALPVATVEPAQEWAPSDHSIRVDVRRLDEALERLSELVVTRFKLARVAGQLAATGADTRELNAVIAENARQLRRLRAAITASRMVPLADLLQRLPLVVRGLTRDTRKSVNVALQTGTAEVDKAVADRLFPAIVHLVRNAVDHAIEPREERRSQGKPEAGTLSIVCDDSSGTSLVITVSDDGRGVDRAALARRLGRPVAASADELLQQMATPGVSTREDATRTSGRGMGMDIVRRTIEMLGGGLSVDTAEGRGTTFRLRVPVSVTIVDVLSFVAGEQVFVAPVAMVDEILEVDASRLVKPPSSASRGAEPCLIERRGEAVPLLALAPLLSRRPDSRVPPRALVVSQARGAIAFGVDRMLGQQEVVIRPLEDSLVRVTGITGATDLGDGKPTLVLDLVTLGAALQVEAAS